MPCDPQGPAVILRHHSLLLAFALLAGATLPLPGSDAATAPALREPAGSCVPQETFASAERDPAQAQLAKYLSRRFFVAREATQRMVRAAWRASADVGLDPFLLLAVVSVESRFNPIAESAMGAKGLMQIIPKYHEAKLLDAGGEAALWDPEENIALGARILQEYVVRAGTLEAGLQYYNGALDDSTAQYAQKVLAERERLLEAARGG
jgi:soluble lytic murein transglycosylase-like protein